MKRAVIIGGTTKSQDFDVSLFDNPDVEIWGINAIRFEWVERWHRMFNLHKYQLLRDYGWPVGAEGRWCAKNRSVPFYSMDPWPDKRIFNWHQFPYEAMASSAVLTSARNNYHCNSFDWLMAYAIYCKFDAVDFYGVNLALDGREQLSSRACLEYWIGFAEARGIQVRLIKSDLFYAYNLVKSEKIYGLDDCPYFEDHTKDAPEGAPYRYDE
jgi:hypothetical protein